MSPIKDLTDVVRLPRLGKIHLGTKHPEKGYPIKADHFVFPKDHLDYKKLVEIFGEAPKELRIFIPVEDEETWGSQYYKCYNMIYGLVCKGDGETALRMVVAKTNELPKVNIPGTVTMKEMPCAGRECPEYKAKKCHEVMNFRFIIPEIPGLGIWQIDTGSKNSILNINSCAKLIKRAFGRISMIPLKLTFEPIQVQNPENGKKQTVYTLNLRTDVTIAQLANAAREQSKMLTVGDLEDAFEIEAERDIEGFWESKPEQPIQIPSAPEVPTSTPEKQQPSPVTESTSDNLPQEVVELEVVESKPELPDDALVTEQQVQHLKEMLVKVDMTQAGLGKWCNVDKSWKVKKFADLTQTQYKEILKAFEKGKP